MTLIEKDHQITIVSGGDGSITLRQALKETFLIQQACLKAGINPLRCRIVDVVTGEVIINKDQLLVSCPDPGIYGTSQYNPYNPDHCIYGLIKKNSHDNGKCS